MRNLKRALSLALAAIMVIGMMVIGAGAKGIDGYADKADIVNADAVALLSDLKVLEGMDGPNGTTVFLPKATLDRQALAKIAFLVATAEVGKDEAGNDLFVQYEGTSGVALNDINNSWAKGAIEWCAANGILEGNGDGTYSPNGLLTVVATAKTLLCALGYDSQFEEFDTDAWALKAITLAKNLNLLDGLTNASASAYITREDACQMAMNALFADTVVPVYARNADGKRYVTSYKDEAGPKLCAKFEISEEPTTGTITAINNQGKTTVEDTTLTVTPDKLGLNVSWYTQEGNTAPLAVTYTGTVVATLNKADYSSKVGTANTKTYVVNGSTAYYNNGVEGDAADVKAGSVIELIDTDGTAKTIEVVRVVNKTVSVLTEGVTKGTGQNANKVTVKPVVSSATDPANITIYEGAAAKDVVLSYTIGNMTYIEKASKVTGKVTSKTNEGVITIAGVGNKTQSGLVAELDETNFKDEFDFYLDNDGAIVLVAATGETPVTPDETLHYAIVQAFGYETSGVGTSIGSSAGTTTYQVKMYFIDDKESKVVTLGEIVRADESKETINTTTCAKEGSLAASYLNKVVTYTTDKNGKFVLTVVEADDDAIKAFTGRANYADGAVANDKTTFVFVTEGEEEGTYVYAVETGYKKVAEKNIASTNGDNDGAIKASWTVLVKDSTVTDMVIIVADHFDGAKSDEGKKAYVLSAAYTEDAEGFHYKAVVKDQVIDLVAESALFPAPGMYEYTVAEGKVTEAELDSEFATVTGITAAGDGIIVIAGETYEYDSATKFYKLENGKCEAVAMDKLGAGANNKNEVVVFTVEDDAEVIDYLYILPAKYAELVNSALGKTDLNGGISMAQDGNTIVLWGATTKITGWTEFSSIEADQEGLYVSVGVYAPTAGASWELKKDGVSYKTGTLAADSEGVLLVLKVDDCQKWSVTFGAGPTAKTYNVDATGVTELEQA